ncbi:serine/threonine-protein kinase, partial [Actinomadura bangladeshensis]
MEPLRQDDPREAGPYRLEGRLGGGGMGRVFLGRSRGGRRVAVKLIRPEFAEDPGFRRRFALEAEAARRVGGFYTAQVVGADPDADPPWLVTAYIPGPSLQQAVAAHGPLPAETVAVLGAGLAEGLTAIHACDLVHRDLKPSNVILAADGPRVIDFGISRALDATSHTHAVVGTPGFMSPEQARGRAVGPASDVFSLACVLAYAATGRGPFGAGPGEAIVYRIVHDEPDLAHLPGALADLVRRCLAKDPAGRPGLSDVLDELSGAAQATPEWLPPPVTTMVTERLVQTPTSPPPPEAPGAAAAA